MTTKGQITGFNHDYPKDFEAFYKKRTKLGKTPKMLAYSCWLALTKDPDNLVNQLKARDKWIKSLLVQLGDAGIECNFNHGDTHDTI